MIRVMIVDDDKLARKGLLTMLPWADYGMEVVGEAANGAKALDFLQHHEVDLCFVDLMMPVMTGLEFIKAAKERYESMQFVVLSFHEDFSFVQKALRMGVIDYISKLELEHANITQIMSRLTEKLRIGSTPREESMGPPSWEEDLLNRHWLYDEGALDQLTAGISREAVPAPYMERLLHRVVLQVESDTGISGILVPRISRSAQAGEFLSRYRRDLLRRADQSSDTGRLAICLMKAAVLVDKDPAADLHTETVAGSLGISRSYFSSSFSKEAGIPFNAFVRRSRIRKAQRLLEEGGCSVARAAELVGYDDTGYFGNLFQDLVGMSPSKYKKLHQDGKI